MSSIIKKPSAWIPIAMSFAALALVFGYLAVFGVTEPQTVHDEGTAAHLWQLLMGGQVPIIAFFALKWLPQMPRHALKVIAIQILAALAACAPVFLLNL